MPSHVHCLMYAVSIAVHTMDSIAMRCINSSTPPSLLVTPRNPGTCYSTLEASIVCPSDINSCSIHRITLHRHQHDPITCSSPMPLSISHHFVVSIAMRHGENTSPTPLHQPFTCIDWLLTNSNTPPSRPTTRSPKAIPSSPRLHRHKHGTQGYQT